MALHPRLPASPSALPSRPRLHEFVPGARFSPPVGLWCPYCHRPFVGVVDRATGNFAHGRCPVGRLDLDRLADLADDEWYWRRVRSRLAG